MIQIPEWKMKKIEDAIRITLNAYKMRTKETCLFRQMCKASEFAKEALADQETSDKAGLLADVMPCFSKEEIQIKAQKYADANYKEIDTNNPKKAKEWNKGHMPAYCGYKQGFKDALNKA